MNSNSHSPGDLCIDLKPRYLVPQNIRSCDFRFADDNDQNDITIFLQLPDLEQRFFVGTRCLIAIENIDVLFSTTNIQWVVLETPQPDEIIIAVASLLFDDANRRVYIQHFASIKNTIAIDFFVSRIESICLSHAFNKVTFCVHLLENEFQSFLSAVEYKDIGGELIVLSNGHQRMKHLFEKDLDAQITSKQQLNPDEFILADPFGDRAEELKALVSDLFIALHKEYQTS